jgi:transcriptional repressor NrdR
MKCPFCSTDNDRVIDSRSVQDGYAIRRRRECVVCKKRYTTYERPDEIQLRVVKKDGSREPFDPEKLRLGLEKACWKRPVTSEQIMAVVTAVEHEIYTEFDAEVDSQSLGELVMQHLRQLDQVAYVRFASVYRQFQDASDFVEEVQPILEDRRRGQK